jgi:hypothetical protein
MGTWGPGLYSSDLASDLRSSIGAVTRLPLDEAQLVQILRDSEPDAANDPANEEYTVFWLVVADQFAKRGIASAEARDTALSIIDSGTDLACFRELGLREQDLRKRAKALDELRARLLDAPRGSTRRVTLKAPQPYTLELGGLYTYPTKRGEPINPYMGPKSFDRAAWIPDGYAVMLVVNRGRAFDYLTWYQPLVTVGGLPEKPTAASVPADMMWRLKLFGTCSPAHFKKLELEAIGQVTLDPEKLRARFPARPGRASWGWHGRIYAVNDITIAEQMSVAPTLADGMASAKVNLPNDLSFIEGLDELLAAPSAP